MFYHICLKLLITVISNDNTVVRSLLQYHMIKYFMNFYHIRAMKLLKLLPFSSLLKSLKLFFLIHCLSSVLQLNQD